MGRTRLSNLQWRVLREISLKNGIVLCETLREWIAEGYSRAVKRGKGIRALWALSGTFRGSFSRSMIVMGTGDGVKMEDIRVLVKEAKSFQEQAGLVHTTVSKCVVKPAPVSGK